jgi:ribosomal subunit interface protein
MATDHPQDAHIFFESHNEEVPRSLRDHGHAEILKIAEKYFGRLIAAKVHFTAEGIGSRCTVNIQMGGLEPITGEALSKDMKLSFDVALEKAAKQLRRAKRELRDDKPARIDKGVLPDGSRTN